MKWITLSSFIFRYQPVTSLLSPSTKLTMASLSGNAEFTPPPKIEDIFSKTAGNKWSSINKPTAGARETVAAPDGDCPIQLYSLGTPNGIKVHIMLEELEAAYDAHIINIGAGDQFKSFFVDANPNSKIPTIVDKDGPDGSPINVFESGSINLYLANKYKQFVPTDPRQHTEMMNWIFWQMGCQGPFTGQFGHFFVYAPADKVEAREYGVSRYGMEALRLCDVLEKHFASTGRPYLVGDEYTVADIMCYPWFRHLRNGLYKHAATEIDCAGFMSIEEKFPLCVGWCDQISDRPAVKRALELFKGDGEEPNKPWTKKEGKRSADAM